MVNKKITSRIRKKLDAIAPEDAIHILKNLAEEDIKTAEKIEQLLTEYLSDVSIDEIAEDIYSELSFIDIEEVWDRSGNTAYGYTEPSEAAWEIFEEILEPFVQKLKRYQELSMTNEAKYCCMGILKGIYMFEDESESQYKDLVEDAPEKYFEDVFDVWKENCNIHEDLEEMENFIKNNFPLWI